MPTALYPSLPSAYLWREDNGPVLDRHAAITQLAAADPSLGELIQRVGPCALCPRSVVTPFQALLRAIVYQQLSGAAARTILGRVRGLYRPKRYPGPADLLATPEAQLRNAGLSSAKVRAVLDLARHAAAREIPGVRRLRGMDPEEIVTLLTRVRGVGRWTVEMLLIFRLGHPDILPVQDLGVRKGFARVYRRRRLPEPEELGRHGERWRPFRSIASWYLWRALELDSRRLP